MYVLIILFFQILIIQYLQNAEEADANNPCSGVVGTQVIGNPFDCSQQLVCMDGILLDTVSCDDGQVLNLMILLCSTSCKLAIKILMI